MKKKNDIEERLFTFVQACVGVAKKMPTNDYGRHIGAQLFSSSTRSGATYNEALASSTRKDFRYKLCETLKELREARYWLRLAVANWEVENGDQLVDEANQLVAILAASCKTLDS